MPTGRIHTPCRVLAIEKPEWWNQHTALWKDFIRMAQNDYQLKFK